MKKRVLEQSAQWIKKAGISYASKTVGKSYPMWMHEVKIPDVLKEKCMKKDESNLTGR